MLKFFLLAAPLLYALAAFKLSAWQTKRHMSRNSSPVSDPEICRLNERLAKAAKLRHVTPKVFEITPINGLAMPDGQIFITRGLMNCHKRGDITSEELSSVIAHELGHLMLGHTKGRLADFAGQNAARMALGFLFSRFVPFFGNILAQAILTLFVKRMSRSDEFAADAYASALLTASGIGTGPQKSLLNKLPKLTGDTGSGIAWMMSHPRIKDRVSEIEKREMRWKTGQPS